MLPRLAVKYDIPISLIPVASVASLPKSIGLVSKQYESTASAAPSTSRATAILHQLGRWLSLSERQTHILGDLTSDLAELGSKVTTKDGQKLLTEYLGERDTDKVITFFSRDPMHR
jgi:hypothetical protein